MLIFIEGGRGQYVPVGVLIIFLFLLIYTLLTFVCRLSRKVNNTVVFALLASVFGVINGACLLYVSTVPYYYSSSGGSSPNYNVLIAALLFGLALAPLTWMSGFSVFAATVGKDIHVKLAYLLTLIQFVLIIVSTVFSGLYINAISRVNAVSRPLLITMVTLRWLYFLLFFALAARYKSHLTRLGKIVLIVFGILNTITLIIETAFLNGFNSGLAYFAYLILRFFLTDFLSAASMVLVITFYKNMTTKDDYMYDN